MEFENYEQAIAFIQEKFSNEHQSSLDSIINKKRDTIIDNWKAKNLEGLISEEVQKRNPQKTKAELEVEQLRAEMEGWKREKQHAELKAYAIQEANTLKLPSTFAELCIKDSQDATFEALTNFNKSMDEVVNQRMQERMNSATDTSFIHKPTQMASAPATLNNTMQSALTKYLSATK